MLVVTLTSEDSAILQQSARLLIDHAKERERLLRSLSGGRAQLIVKKALVVSYRTLPTVVKNGRKSRTIRIRLSDAIVKAYAIDYGNETVKHATHGHGLRAASILRMPFAQSLLRSSPRGITEPYQLPSCVSIALVQENERSTQGAMNARLALFRQKRRKAQRTARKEKLLALRVRAFWQGQTRASAHA